MSKSSEFYCLLMVEDLRQNKGINRRRQWHPTPVLLPGKSHGRKSLVGCSPWGRSELDMTERLHFPFSLSCIGEGNGSPLQCSCLENPRNRGAWWAAVSGVTQSPTQLKQISSSSSSKGINIHMSIKIWKYKNCLKKKVVKLKSLLPFNQS